MKLDEIIAGIPKIPAERYRAARQHWDTLAKPLGSLGVLEENVTKIAALSGKRQLSRRTLLVFCSDNGVVAQGVSQSDASVTTAVAAALGRGDSTVNFMAKTANCTVLPVDIGMLEPTPPGVQKEKRMPGTHDITLGPAMTRETCIRAIETGFRLAEKQIKTGADILLLGEMGIGNTTTSAAVLAVLTGADIDTVTGRGGGLTDEGFARKKAVLRRAVTRRAIDRRDVLDVLTAVGGLDLAAMTGAFLGCAHERIPAAADGFISVVAALCAVRLCPAAADYIFLSHDSYEPGYRMAARELGMTPCLHLGMRLGEGSGCPLLFRVLEGACGVMRGMATFAEAAIQDDYLEEIRAVDAFTVEGA